MRLYFLLGIIILANIGLCEDGFDLDRDSRSTNTRQRSSRDDRLREQKEQAEQVYSKAEDNLAFMLSAVSSNQSIDEDKLSEISKDFMAARRVYRLLEKEQQSVLMLLEAWTTYFTESDPVEALKRTERSCMLNPLSGNAYDSAVVFSVLSGRQPKSKEMILRLVKKRRDMENPVMDSSDLDVDVPEFSRILIGREVPVPKTSENAIEDSYSCVLLWTLKPEPIDTENFEKLKAMKEQLPPEKRAVVEELINKEPVNPEEIKKEVTAFSSLYENNTAKDKVDFLSINVDETVVLNEFLKTNSPSPQPIPAAGIDAMSKEVGQAIKMTGALMLVIDKNNKVRYAGSSEGFLPVMLLNHLVPGSQKEREIEKKSAPSGGMDMHGMGMPGMMGEMPSTQPNEKVADSNSLPEPEKDTEEVKEQEELTDQQRQENTNNLKPEQQVEAEKLLNAARMFRGSHTRLGSSRRVAESCFEVIEKFPGTTYEAEARKILDSIPAHQKKKYGIEE